MKTQMINYLLGFVFGSFYLLFYDISISNQNAMNSPLFATLDIYYSKGQWVDLHIVNQHESAVKVYTAVELKPFGEWQYSVEAYQIAALQSFNILEISLVDENGNEMKQLDGFSTPYDHVFSQIDLQPKQELTISIPLFEFYKLESGKNYIFYAKYGRGKNSIRVNKTIKVK